MTKNRRPSERLNPATREALETILSYLWTGEERSYSEEPRDDHVFLALKTVRTWLEQTAAPAPRFELGKLYLTPGAQAALPEAERLIALARHVTGDWGDCGAEDWRENDFSLDQQLRLFSVYHLPEGTKFWVITEADRSATTVLLPDEY